MTVPRTVLLVEDNEDDVFALKWVLKKTEIKIDLQTVGDGQRAIDYLAGVGTYADRGQCPLPALILLDLKLPYRNGMEVLAWIRARPAFDGIPVVILSGSDEARDHERATGLGALDYLVKPPDPAGLTRVLGPVVGL